MRLIKGLFLTIVVFLGVTFACLNADKVSINLYIGIYDVHLSLLLLITLGLGLILGVVLMSFSYLKLKAVNMKIKKQSKWAEKEIKNLRAIPQGNE